MMAKRASSTPTLSLNQACRTTMIEKSGQPYAKEVEDYKQGVATPPEEQRGRESPC